MKAMHLSETLQELCKSSKKHGMFISFQFNEVNTFIEILKAAPYLDNEDYSQIMVDGYGYLLFDSEKEMMQYYNQTIGDDGPTELNPYDGKLARVYALTCYPNGTLGTENT